MSGCKRPCLQRHGIFFSPQEICNNLRCNRMNGTPISEKPSSSSDSEDGFFLNSDCTSSRSSCASVGGQGVQTIQLCTTTPVSATTPESGVENTSTCHGLVSLELLPEGILERIYGFCPECVILHLSVSKRFAQQLPFADAVCIRPKLAARQVFVVPHYGGRSHPSFQTTALCVPHWSAPPVDAWTDARRLQPLGYNHKDYPEGAAMSKEDASTTALPLPTHPLALARFKGRVHLHVDDARWERMSPVILSAVTGAKPWIYHLDPLYRYRASLKFIRSRRSTTLLPPSLVFCPLCSV